MLRPDAYYLSELPNAESAGEGTIVYIRNDNSLRQSNGKIWLPITADLAALNSQVSTLNGQVSTLNTGVAAIPSTYPTIVNPSHIGVVTLLEAAIAKFTNSPWIDVTAPGIGAVMDAKRTTTAAITASGTTLTSATDIFVVGDVGKSIDIQNAGTPGTSGGHHRTTIAQYFNARSVRVTNAAVTTVSNVIAQWGTDDSAAWNVATALLRTLGKGRLYVPYGNSICQSAVDIRGLSSVVIEGAGRGLSQVWAGANMDSGGADQYQRSSLFQAVQFTADDNLTSGPDGNAVWTGHPTRFQNYLTFKHLTIDCTFQSTTGEPVTPVGGYSAAVIEFQDVSSGRVEDCDIIGGWGNGVVFGSIDPRVAASITNCSLRDVTFTNCIRGILPNYGITGSVIQFGAAKYCSMERVQILNCSGPAWDAFNVDHLDINDMYIEGWNGTTVGSGNFGNIGAGHSDFGANRIRIKNYTSINAGGFVMLGQMSDQYVFNGYVRTPGPQNCTLENVNIIGTAMKSITAPAIVSGTSTTPFTDFSYGVELTISNGASVNLSILNSDNTTYATLLNPRTTAGVYRFVVPVGKKANISWTGSPSQTWAWYAMPNASTPSIMYSAGSIGSGTSAASCSYNTLRNVRIQQPSGAGVRLIDCTRTTLDTVVIEDPGYWDTAQAYGLNYVGAYSLSSFNQVRSLEVIDNEPSATKRLKGAVWEDSSNAGAQNNTLEGSRLTNGINGALVMLGGSEPGLLQVTAPSVPSSTPDGTTNATQNPFPHDVLINFTTVTNIAVNSAFLGIGSGWVWVPHLGSVGLNYTGTPPTWKWYRA